MICLLAQECLGNIFANFCKIVFAKSKYFTKRIIFSIKNKDIKVFLARLIVFWLPDHWYVSQKLRYFYWIQFYQTSFYQSI